jgi:hypothetical protein
MKIFRNLVKRSADPREDFLAESKLRSITNFDPCDIFFAGYPKSGHTWM